MPTSSSRTTSPRVDLETLASWGTENLTRVVAIDSQSDERSQTIPSTEGQRRLSDALRAFFAELGLEGEQDAYANLIVRIPATPGATGPALALMVHMDTSEGTEAIPALEVVPRWDGSRIAYPANGRLTVSAERYPATRDFVGHDVLHGPGRGPLGLDDKLGMSELMTLAQVLVREPAIPHGDVLLVFRPDEEIGRMAAVEGLSVELARRGVRYGYTVDGIGAFEVNAENFNAARAKVSFAGRPLAPTGTLGREVTLRIEGCKTHGATAKAEGYLNATVVLARAGIVGPVPVDFRSDSTAEVNADVTWLLSGDTEAALDRAEADLVARIEAVLAPHAWKGAAVTVTGRAAPTGTRTDAAVRLVEHLSHFLHGAAGSRPSPLLSEDSEGFQGYSNPYFVERDGDGLCLHYRLRDFDPERLRAREAHIREVASLTDLPVVVAQQYINMGPAMARHPELVTWAETALAALGETARRTPIRGGTGVDPFLAKGIPVANLGTGYFAPESEKELTSRQMLAKTALWLVHLVQVVAQAA